MNKFAKTSLAVTFVLVSFVFLSYEISVTIFSANKSALEKADAIVVLGSGYADSAKGRALAGLYLYENKFAPIIVLAGGQTGYPVTEAKFMSDYIYSKRPNALLLLEQDSKNTLENLKNVYDQIGGKDKSIIIVSDNFHLLRSYFLAKRIGFKKVQWYGTENIGIDRAESKIKDNLSEFLKIINLTPTFLFGVKI